MKRSLFLLLALFAGAVFAQSTYRWVDQDGKVHFGDRPPPAKAAREVEQKKYSTPATTKPLSFENRRAAEASPVTLFVAPECAALCKQGRDYLDKRGIPYSEKSLASTQDINEMRTKLGGGDVVVPVLQVGSKYSRGFLESSWSDVLDAAGYSKSGAP